MLIVASSLDAFVNIDEKLHNLNVVPHNSNIDRSRKHMFVVRCSICVILVVVCGVKLCVVHRNTFEHSHTQP